MNVLVLGSSGLIGTTLCKTLESQGHSVSEFDIEHDPSEDLRIDGAVDDAISQCDAVMFLAFDVGGAKYLEKYQHTYDFINNNVKILENTFESIRKHDKPFIYTSSQMIEVTDSTYGTLKYLGEKYAKTLGGITVRLWNVYGYEETGIKSHVIPDFVEKARAGNIDLMTDGSEERQFLYVDDCCDCFNTILENYDDLVKHQTPIHVSSFKWVSVLELGIMIACEFEGCKVTPNSKCDQVQTDSMIQPDEFILNYWQPKTSLIQGVREIINIGS
jgi:nucleoside-diphosphate-sugar epimerase